MTTSTVATRNPAWYKLGATVPEGTMDAAAAMKAGNLNGWNVRKEEMTTTESGIVVPNRVATVRTDALTGATEYLGYVGHGYNIHQNEEMFGFLDSIVDSSGAHYDSAGMMKNGAKVFTTLKMPEGLSIGGEDAVDLYLLATNGHDGFTPFTVAVTPIRLMCTNQLSMALRTAKQSWKIRHTTNMAGRVAEARQSLDLTFAYMDAFTAEMEQMLDTGFTEAQFAKVTKNLMPKGHTERAEAKQVEKRAALMSLFVEAETNAFGRGTKYGAYNALTEYADWVAPVRGDHDGTRRALRVMDGDAVQSFKNTAHRVLTAA